MFVGAMTALVTPFRDGRVDDAALAALVEAQLAAGVDALVPCGTTGESPTLSSEEHAHVVRLVVEVVARRVPVIAGAGSNSTAHAIALARLAAEAGADGLLVVTPYYNRPTQDGLVRHFRAVAEAVPLPLVVYNVPGRTGVDFGVDGIVRLASEQPRVVAVKEASGSVARAQELVRRLGDQVGDRVAVLSGDDAINVGVYAVGGRGCISVTANVAPAEVAAVWDAAAAGDFARARALHLALQPLNEALFLESNPIPVKAALAMAGRIGPELRAPLYPMAGPTRERLRAVLAEHGLV